MKGDESLVLVVTEVVSNQFKAIKKISVFSVNTGKKYFIWVFWTTPLYWTIVIIMVKILYSGVLDR